MGNCIASSNLAVSASIKAVFSLELKAAFFFPESFGVGKSTEKARFEKNNPSSGFS